jgi:hypothetical protein
MSNTKRAVHVHGYREIEMLTCDIDTANKNVVHSRVPRRVRRRAIRDGQTVCLENELSVTDETAKPSTGDSGPHEKRRSTKQLSSGKTASWICVRGSEQLQTSSQFLLV